MAKTIVSQPSAIFPAYNPAPLVIGASNSEADVEMHLVIDGVSVTHHKREFFSLAEPLTDNFGNPITDNDGMPIPIGSDPVAVFDLGKLARNYFSNALVEVNAALNVLPDYTKAYIDRRLCVPFTAEITGVSAPEFTAINAALGVGVAEANYNQRWDKILTEMPTFKYYRGFSDKSRISVLISAAGPIVGDSLYFNRGGALGSVSSYLSNSTESADYRVLSIDIPTLDTIASIELQVEDANENLHYHNVPASHECVPSSPFYVRWVNRIGGREHWMFSRRQTDKTDIDESVTYDPRIETNADLGRFPRQIGLTSSHTVTVGAEGIPNAEFDVLRRITTSPLIEYYDEGIAEWRVITIKSGETAKDTASPVQSIELEFNLPSPALQF